MWAVFFPVIVWWCAFVRWSLCPQPGSADLRPFHTCESAWLLSPSWCSWGAVDAFQACLLLQHHPRWVWSRPLLPGPVARRPRQALQLRGPGNMDADRRLAHWGWLRGTSGWLFVHLAAVTCFKEERSLANMLCLWESTCFEGLVCVFNVQHLYFACLDEGKIKNSEPCLSGIWFSLPEKFFFFCEKI